MAYNQLKLKAAVKSGFVPKALKQKMSDRGHVAQLQVVDEINDGHVGVSYQINHLDGTHSNYTEWYTSEEIEEMLNESTKS